MKPFAQDFILSNRPRHRIARHSAFWLVFIVFSAVTYGFIPISMGIPAKFGIPVWTVFAVAFGDAVLFTLNHALLAYLIIYFLLPRFFFRSRYLALFAGLVCCVLFSVLVSVVVSNYLVNLFHSVVSNLAASVPGLNTNTPQNDPFANRNAFAVALMAGLRGGITIAGFATATKLGKYYYLKQQSLMQTEKEKLTAELQLLKAQVHPHFLFNTLNNLYALTLRKSDGAPEMVLKLSGLLSYMLYECNATEVPLEKEIRMLENYVDLEKLRYGSRLDVSLNFTGDIRGKTITPLLLIPFVENAFKHGSSEQLEQAWISLDLAVEGNRMSFKLVNSKDANESPGGGAGGIGLVNVRKRLELIHANNYELKITPQEETFLVYLSLELGSGPLAGATQTSIVQTTARLEPA